MKKLSAWQEFLCVLGGHEFNEIAVTSEDNGFVLRQVETCSNCGISVIDESGYLQRAHEAYAGSSAIPRQVLN